MRSNQSSVLTVDFEIFGQSFAALNSGPQFPHSEAVSFQISCESQEIWTTTGMR